MGIMVVQKLTNDAIIPTRAYADDAGFDFYVSEDTVIAPGEFVDVPLGVSIALPPKTWGLFIGRSSTAHNLRLMVMTSVIDPGYRGPMFAMVYNIGRVSQVLSKGQRIAQLVPIDATPSRSADLVEVDDLEAYAPSAPGGRGTGAFGSSGK